MRRQGLLLLLAAALLGACGANGGGTSAAPTASAPAASTPANAQAGTSNRLRLATTTSTQDSGLLDAILPDFEQQYQVKVDVVAVGTGQALKLGQNGDADVVLVHARKQEDAFVTAGYGINRRDVMYNDFIVIGPADDPAGIKSAPSVVDAFKAIAAKGATFAARGDNSGTSTKELGIWATAGISPTTQVDWYKSLGQGMGETLITANEQRAYTLSDRATYLATRDKLPNLAILLGSPSVAENKDKTLLNPYGVIPVNPAKQPSVNTDLSEKFAEWITSPATQAKIAAYGKDTYGQALFIPGKAP
jgi:tungstate transport system substrate-binding protein